MLTLKPPIIGHSKLGHWKLREEIEHAQKDVAIAKRQFDHADSLFIDSAAMKLQACEMRLNALYAEAKREGVSV